MRILRISNALDERFANFNDLEAGFAIFSNSFSVNVEEIP